MLLEYLQAGLQLREYPTSSFAQFLLNLLEWLAIKSWKKKKLEKSGICKSWKFLLLCSGAECKTAQGQFWRSFIWFTRWWVTLLQSALTLTAESTVASGINCSLVWEATPATWRTTKKTQATVAASAKSTSALPSRCLNGPPAWTSSLISKPHICLESL